jgi:hypothetical protein
MAPRRTVRQLRASSGQTALVSSTSRLGRDKKNRYNPHGLAAMLEAPARRPKRKPHSAAALAIRAASINTLGVIAIAIVTGAAQRAVHIKPVGQALALIATGEWVAGAAGDAAEDR